MKDKMKKIIIGITDCSKWKNYHDWFASENIEIINLSNKKNNHHELKKCNGVVLSGGEDVHPEFYGKPEYLSMLDRKEINEARDEFELKIIDETVKNKIPLLGICRGLQIVNVYFGGTLIPHLNPPASKREGVRHSKDEGYDQIHKIIVEPKSLLREIVSNHSIGKWIRNGTAVVNSAHHQAADKTGKELKVSAKAEDGVTEALEYNNSLKQSFLLLVQWHPERMKDRESAFAKNIKNVFLSVCRKK
jgi:putative glutamine amidotransferase